MRAQESAAAIAIHPLTPERWDELVALFGKSGAQGGCWCMYWRFTNKEYSNSNRENNRAQLRALAEQPIAPGLLAYMDGEPAGWIGLGPRNTFARLEKSKHIKAVDEQPVWSVICFFVRSRHRGRGIAKALLKEAIKYAVQHGAPALEAYPVENQGQRVSIDGAYPGTVSLFRAAGFEQVATTNAISGGYPRVVMRRTLS